MRRTIIINLSPRGNGTSAMLSKYFSDRMEGDKNQVQLMGLYSSLPDINRLLEEIKNSDSIVMIGPCYVDTYPADTIYLLEQMAEQKGVLHGQSLYGLIQGGMPYVHTHESGLHLLENFSDENDVVWKCGFVMGGGAMLNGSSLDHIVGAKKIVPAVNEFIENIANDKKSPDSLYQKAAVKIPVFVAFLLVKYMNASIRKKLNSKGIDYRMKSPYLQ